MIATSDRLQARRWLFAICAAVLLQSMYPSGYMPASAADGWPIMLCPDGMPAGFMTTGHPGHHQHGSGDESPKAADSCPVGKAFESQPVPVASVTLVSVFVSFTRSEAPVEYTPIRRIPAGFRARAPPADSLA